MNRRSFLRASLAGAATASLVAQGSPPAGDDAAEPLDIIDTNVNLFDWPFRALKYRDSQALAAKLRSHRVIQAWAGNFEALFSKDMRGVNERLASECARHEGFLVPFGSVNIAWPDWREDVRRCHEIHKMPGIRIYPGYQPFDLAHSDMGALVTLSAERGMILQIVFGMEDPRVHHPILEVRPVAFAPLLRAIEAAPEARIQLVHFPGSPTQGLAEFFARPNTYLDISRLEGNGAIGRMIGTVQGLPSARVSTDRLVFGSHAPYFPIETAILKLIESPLGRSQLTAIMQGNAQRLLRR